MIDAVFLFPPVWRVRGGVLMEGGIAENWGGQMSSLFYMMCLLGHSTTARNAKKVEILCKIVEFLLLSSRT